MIGTNVVRARTCNLSVRKVKAELADMMPIAVLVVVTPPQADGKRIAPSAPVTLSACAVAAPLP
eukprot:CAMPEP_0180678008 /NCGR_PEP_ID=MMETSP1037_2-20121125/68152_1 /TAXON_ID=632150 /ORGANISM="Azadinium spinosum, Strain 3D9" /LENGTH=63 /DNA_ID=CAMNT_0022707621 /DNA_START=493 /DNA_END=682 /DNA_ORIENTATION=+